MPPQNPPQPPAESESEPKVADREVRIRMYGQGLGDCFLLTFPRTAAPDASATDAARPFVHVVIDCGVIGGMPSGPERMKAVVNDISVATHGNVDLLILTHEHWDHVSGFVQAAEEWAAITVHALWTAWTESDDPGGLPAILKKIADRQTRSLAAVADRAVRFGMRDQFAGVLGLMSFMSDQTEVTGGFSAAKGVHDAFDAAKQLVEPAKRVLCEPGDVHRVPGTDVHAYVLGPPRSDARLRQMDPKTGDEETYPNNVDPVVAKEQRLADLNRLFSLRALVDGRSGFNGLVMPLLAPGSPFAAAPSTADPLDDEQTADRELYERSFPFTSTLRVPLPVAERDATAQRDVYPALAAYFDELNHWRRTDFDWLLGAEAFALRADHLTNNTSLVIAFELPAAAGEKRQMLLFTGDAQVGNWLSWDEIKAWRPIGDAQPGEPTPNIDDLLGQTVFYKVGHHGSHNATLKTKGVERMPKGGQLSAFVPVSVPVAHQIKRWGKMPLGAVLNALNEHSPGRVLLPNATAWPAPDRVPDSVLANKGFRSATTTLPEVQSRGSAIETPVPLWVELTIPFDRGHQDQGT